MRLSLVAPYGGHISISSTSHNKPLLSFVPIAASINDSMSIRLVPREEIDKTKWNSCIHYAVNGNIFGYMWYLDAMAREWDALVEGDYESVMPLTHKEVGWRKQGLVQPPLVRELAIYSINPPSNKRNAAFWEALPEEYQRVNLRLDSFSQPKLEGWTNKELTNYFLPLNEPYELIRERYSQQLIDRLEIAKETDLFPVSSLKPERIAELFRKSKGVLSEPEFHGLQRIMYNILHRGWGFASGIMTREKEVLAADFFIFSHGRIMSLAPVVTAAGKEIYAQEYLYDLMIRQQAGKPQSMDFNSATSQVDFARQFGAIHYEYYQVEKDRPKGWRGWF